MAGVLSHQGICFVILRFTTLEEVYLLEANHLLRFWERMMQGGRKSITKAEIETHGHHIPLGFTPRIDYLKVLDSLYHFN